MVIFLRHAEPLIDEGKSKDQWELTEKAIKDTKINATFPHLNRINLIYTSPEMKALQTATIISDQIKADLMISADLKEVDHQVTKFMTNEEYLNMKNRYFYGDYPGEKIHQAFYRIYSFMSRIESLHPDKEILLVSHGTLLATLFGKMKELHPEKMYDSWKNLSFLSWGWIIGGRISKSIFDRV
ncbi:MAG: phosphoglycerate mutase family protein [Candidatus Heimdallarchaeota archaeon]|nr:phosphoglycerate mutase family protein [Candidatus Heimdallarchaeota archaeon]MDH5646381.1 phosphoglycerate mutase family protein [Candidatus Heimdallarchaeota archaeon]